MPVGVGVTAASRYAQLLPDREPFLRQAENSSEFTIPSLIPRDGQRNNKKLYVPFQSLCARGVNHLASKLVLTLLPPVPFFRLIGSEKVLQQLQPGEDQLLDAGLSKVENAVQRSVERRSIRAHAFEVFKHLQVAGNVVMFIPRKGNCRVFPLYQYVALRDPEGSMLELVIKESVDRSTVPQYLLNTVQNNPAPATTSKCVELYTHVKWNYETGRVTCYQEINGNRVAGSEGSYPIDRCPWLVMRWIRIDGESYGRGHCEENYGDIASCEALNKAIVELAVVAAKIVFLCRRGGTTNLEDVQRARPGECIEGDHEDISTLQVDKLSDLSVARTVLEQIEKRIEFAFLMQSAIRRNAERVTAEELRLMAEEIESSLGGVYTVFATEFQLPLVKLLLGHLQADGTLPAIPKNTVEPTIITGIDALGRSQELSRLDAAIGTAVQLFGPQSVVPSINVPGYLRRRLIAAGAKPDDILLSPEQMQANTTQASNQALAEKLGPAAVREYGQSARQAQQQT